MGGVRGVLSSRAAGATPAREPELAPPSPSALELYKLAEA